MTETIIGMREATIAGIFALITAHSIIFAYYASLFEKMYKHYEYNWVTKCEKGYGIIFFIAVSVDVIAIVFNIIGEGLLQTILSVCALLLTPVFPALAIYCIYYASKEHLTPLRGL